MENDTTPGPNLNPQSEVPMPIAADSRIEQAVLEAFRAAGLPCADGTAIEVDTPKLISADIEGEALGSRHLWYSVRARGRRVPVVFFGASNRPQLGKQRVLLSNVKVEELSPEDREELSVAESELHRLQEEQRLGVAQECAEVYAQLPAATAENGYLKKKDVTACDGLKQDADGCLIVPCYDERGNLWTLQRITADGFKAVAPGSRFGGLFFVVGGANGGKRLPDGCDRALVCEGIATALTLNEATGLPVVSCFSAGNIEKVVEALSATLPKTGKGQSARPICELVICADNDRQTEAEGKGNPGRDTALKVAKRFGLRIVWSAFSTAGPGSDFNDLFYEAKDTVARNSGAGEGLRQAALEQVKRQVDRARLKSPEKWKVDEAINWLLTLSESDRTIQIPTVADSLEVRAPALREAIKKAQRGEDEGSISNKRNVAWEEVQAWPEPVELLPLLAELVAFFSTYVRAPKEYHVIAALWVIGTHLMKAWTWFPRIFIGSAGENSGKSTLGACIVYCCPRGFELINVTQATLFRVIDADHPTLFLDEADVYLERNPDVISVLNNGHKSDGVVPRCEEVVEANGCRRMQIRFFSVYGPVILAGIGDLRRTLKSRCIPFQMVPAAGNNQPPKWTPAAKAKALELARKAARWVQDHAAAVDEFYRTIESFGTNRQDDNARPLLAIAAVAGAEWLETAKQALRYVWDSDYTPPSVAHRLLLGVVRIFLIPAQGGKPPRALQAEDLAKQLAALPDAEWGRARRGQPVDADWVRDQLRSAFKLRTGQAKIGKATLRGFRWEDIQEVVRAHHDGLLEAAKALDAPDEVIQLLAGGDYHE